MKKFAAVLASVILLGLLASPANGGFDQDVLQHLRLAPESKSSTYKRSNFKHWIDADKDKCDTRSEVLISESLTQPRISNPCKVNIGEWFSKYDERVFYVASLLDIDHMVPLKEAWESGASSWTPARREAFANDLGFADSLLAVSASSNRSKGDRDPSGWLPPAKGQICDYVVAWVGVKYRWDLTIDSLERSALARGLQTCPPGSTINLPAKAGKPGTEKTVRSELPEVELVPTATPTPSPTPTATPTPTPSPTSGASVLRGRPWNLSIEGPKEFSRGDSFSLRLRLTDIEGLPVANKTINYTSWNLSGFTSVTDTQGYVDLKISPLASWNEVDLSFSSDFASGRWLVVVQSVTATPTPTPTPSPSDGSSTFLPLVTPGAFCARSEAGTRGRSATGVVYVCSTSSTENRLRWRR